MFCQQCGAENKQDAKYCLKCGTALTPRTEGPLVSDVTPPRTVQPADSENVQRPLTNRRKLPGRSGEGQDSVAHYQQNYSAGRGKRRIITGIVLGIIGSIIGVIGGVVEGDGAKANYVYSPVTGTLVPTATNYQWLIQAGIAISWVAIILGFIAFIVFISGIIEYAKERNTGTGNSASTVSSRLPADILGIWDMFRVLPKQNIVITSLNQVNAVGKDFFLQKGVVVLTKSYLLFFNAAPEAGLLSKKWRLSFFSSPNSPGGISAKKDASDSEILQPSYIANLGDITSCSAELLFSYMTLVIMANTGAAFFASSGVTTKVVYSASSTINATLARH